MFYTNHTNDGWYLQNFNSFAVFGYSHLGDGNVNNILVTLTERKVLHKILWGEKLK